MALETDFGAQSVEYEREISSTIPVEITKQVSPASDSFQRGFQAVDPLLLNLAYDSRFESDKDNFVLNTIRSCKTQVQLEQSIQEEMSYLNPFKNRVIAGLRSIIRDADPGTAEHSDEVAKLAVHYGEKFGMSDKQITKLWIAGELHDWGKINKTVDKLVNYRGPLDNQEQKIVGKHTQIGGDILDKLGISKISPDYQEVVNLVRGHHDKLDGKNIMETVLEFADQNQALGAENLINKNLAGKIEKLY